MPMAIAKIICSWAGMPGAPGYSIFYQNNTVGNPAPLATFFAAIQAYYPSTVTVTVPNSGEVIDEVTGKMVNVWTNGTQVTTPGTGAGTAYPPSQGAQVKWNTNVFRNGRRVGGRTFLVPLTVAVYGQGALTTTVANAINAAATTLITGFAGSMVVWSRPVYRPATIPGDPPVRIRDGAISSVSTSTVPLKCAVLSGRRDT